MPKPILPVLALVSIAAMSAGCAGSIKPVLEDAPPSLREPCQTPVDLPDRDISQAEIVALWGRDRVGLRTCGDRHEAVVQFYTSRDSALRKDAR